MIMKSFIQIIIITTISISLFGQHGDRHYKSERIESMRIAFITEELDLSVSEAQLFWPVFNQYEKEKQSLRSSKYGIIKSEQIYQDGEASDQLSQLILLEEREYLLKREYITQLQEILNPSKVLKLMSLDKRFKEDLLKNLRSRSNSEKE